MEPLLIDRWLRGHDVIEVIDSASASVVREAVRELAGAQGLDAKRTGSIVTAASELVTNQLTHARNGAVSVRPIARGDTAGIEIVAADGGGGLATPAAALAGGVPSRTGLGIGLSGARRLADEMDVDVRMGEGTCIWLRKFARPVLHRAEIGIYGAPHPDERVSGDDTAFVRSEHDLRVAVADGLGHGPAAREASSAAIESFLAAPREELGATMERAGQAARGTRGTVMSLVRLVEGARDLEHLAVGNVITQITRPHDSTRFSGASFVLGLAGGRARAVIDATTLGPRDVLVMFTDGLTTRVILEEGMLDQPAIAIAEHLVRRFDRKNDDALAVVVR